MALNNSINAPIPVGITKGGTGQVTQAAGYDALSPTTTQGDISWRGTTNNVRLAGGTINQVLAVTGVAPITLGWVNPASGTVTSVTLASPNTNAILSGTNPITTSGTITINIGTKIDYVAAKSCIIVGPGTLNAASGNNNINLGVSGFPNITATGANNTAIGNIALDSVTDGQSNTGIGYGALTNVTTGNGNFGLGQNAVSGISTGSDNVGIGGGTLENCDSATSNVIAIGAAALNQAAVALSDSVFVGGSSGVTDALGALTASNCGAIGTNSRVNDSNMMQIGGNAAGGLGMAIGLNAYPNGGTPLPNTNGSAIYVANASPYRLKVAGPSSSVTGTIPTANTNISVGKSTVATGTSTLTVNTAAAKTASVIFVSIVDEAAASANLALGVGTTNINNGVSFDIVTSGVAVGDLNINWWIVTV